MVSDDDIQSAKEEFNMEEAEKDSASAFASASASAPRKLLMLNPSTTSHGIRANPLKHVAHLLRQKLVAAHGAPCNMLQVALELHSQAQMEKVRTVDRIIQKRRLCDTLSKQVAILQKLVEENQENSETSGDHGDIFSELSSLHSLEGYCDMDYLICDSFVDQQRPFTPKRLHLPFVMLATNPDANVDICMTGDPPYQVHLQLDQSYCLIDHIQMIKMLPEGRTDKHPQQQPESSFGA